MIGIYKITNLINGKVYIGQSIDIKQRWFKHKSAAFNIADKNYEYPLYRAIRKYGLDNFLFEVLEECSKDELCEKEKFYIAKYHAHGKCGYNQDDGGNGGSHNFKLTDEDITAIIARLKYSMDNAFIIGADFGVGGTTIKNINRGLVHRRDNETYPIRPKLWSITYNENGKYENKPTNNFCSICGKEIGMDSNICADCNALSQRKVLCRPTPLELARYITEYGFEETGRRLGVSGNAVKKWCKRYKMPIYKQEIISWYNRQISK
jgi:group I intron endonuclease